MNELNLQAVDKVENISSKDFKRLYFKPLIPVVLKDFAKDWPALKKWNVDYFKKTYGDNLVKTYNSDFKKPGKSYMGVARLIKFKDFLDKVLTSNPNLKMFLYNIKKECPTLAKDIIKPNLVKGFSDNFYFMFFGAKGNETHLHIDIDMGHVFHTTFNGKKRFILFPENESRHLYRHPFTVRSYADADHPDFKKYPKMKLAKGYEVTIEPGETLFIPAGYWHQVFYEEDSFALALRCANQSFMKRLEGIYNVLFMQVFDRILNSLLGKKWFNWKTHRAKQLAEA